MYDGIDELGARQGNLLNTPAGILRFNYDVSHTGSSNLPDDLSSVTLGGNKGEFFTLRHGGVILKGNDVSFLVGRDHSVSVKGHAQHTHDGGLRTTITNGDNELVEHDTSPEVVAAAKSLRDSHHEIQNKAIEAFESTKPSKVKCKICNSKLLHQKADALAGKILNTIEKYHLWPPYIPFPKEKIQKILSTLVIPFLSHSTNRGVGGPCGNPSCKDGMMDSDDSKYQAFNDTKAKLLKEKQDQHLEWEKKVSNDASIRSHGRNIHIHVGIPNVPQDFKRHAKGSAYVHRTGLGKPRVKAGENEGDASKGAGVKQIGAKKDPLKDVGCDRLPFGDFTITSDHFDVTTNSHGIHFTTSGPFNVKASDIEIVSTESILTLSSNCKTILKGKNILIDANDADAHGIEVQSKASCFTGAVSVLGDLYVKGAIKQEGSLHTPSLVTRDMSMFTTLAGACDTNAHAAIHNSVFPIPNGFQATIYNAFGLALKAIITAIELLDIEKLICTLWNWVMESLNLTKLLIPVENTGIPTGFAMIYDCITHLPVECWVADPDIAGSPVAVGAVRPACIPIWTHPHNHPMISGDHNHEVSVPAYSGYPEIKDVHAVTEGPSHVPSAPVEPMGYCPGPKSLPSSCGGGGAGFGTAKTLARNQKYGINTLDPFNGLNYVDTTLVNYTTGGQITPAPKFTLQC